MNVLEQLVERAQSAPPNERIELRDSMAAHGIDAIDAMAEWLADPLLTRFAVRVIGRLADLGQRDAASESLRTAREEATPDQGADIEMELHQLGFDTRKTGTRRSTRAAGQPVDPSVPGWMMRTNRDFAEWLWSEVEAGRLRQGWGYQPKQDLTLLRHRRDQGQALDVDDENALRLIWVTAMSPMRCVGCARIPGA